MIGISVIIPVGPKPEHRQYVSECIGSIYPQLTDADEIIFVFDGGEGYVNPQDWDIPAHEVEHIWLATINDKGLHVGNKIHHFYLPHTSGPAVAWNTGIALAHNDYCLMMGADDKLLMDCLDVCRKAIEKRKDPYGYYNIPCITSDLDIIGLANNAAVVGKKLWEVTGGFHPLMHYKWMDHLYINCMSKHMSAHLYQVSSDPYYWVRIHDHQHSKFPDTFTGVLDVIRSALYNGLDWKI